MAGLHIFAPTLRTRKHGARSLLCLDECTIHGWKVVAIVTIFHNASFTDNIIAVKLFLVT
jgi:hypothetical protein